MLHTCIIYWCMYIYNVHVHMWTVLGGKWKNYLSYGSHSEAGESKKERPVSEWEWLHHHGSIHLHDVILTGAPLHLLTSCDTRNWREKKPFTTGSELHVQYMALISLSPFQCFSGEIEGPEEPCRGQSQWDMRDKYFRHCFAVLKWMAALWGEQDLLRVEAEKCLISPPRLKPRAGS